MFPFSFAGFSTNRGRCERPPLVTAPSQVQSALRVAEHSRRAASCAARQGRAASARWSIAVPWRERPPFWTAWPAKRAATEVVAHATLSLPQPELVVVGYACVQRGIEGVRICIVNSGRRAAIVRLATRALKALRASSVPLRPRCARLAALTARVTSRSDGNHRRPQQKRLTTVSSGATV